MFATLSDKDMAGVVCALKPIIDTWHCVSLNVPRATGLEKLSTIVKQVTQSRDVVSHTTVSHALKAALANVKQSKRAILVAGSFYTIAAVRDALVQQQRS